MNSQKWHYVYYHIDPHTNEIMYVGKGSAGRAWYCLRNDHSEDHHEWIQSLLDQGFTPEDWVQITRNKLVSEEAYRVEARTIKRLKPRFNRHGQTVLTCLSDDQCKKVIDLREKGIPFYKIAEEIGSTPMTVNRFYHQKDDWLRQRNGDYGDFDITIKHREKLRDGMLKNSITSGRIWVNDGIKNKRVYPNAIPEGFTRGRI